MDRVPLEIAAERSGVLPGYHDCHGAWRAARPEVVRAALAAMGVEPDARGRYALPAPPPIDPMAVAWQDTPTQLPCRIPPDLYGDTMEVHIGTDEGAALAEWRLAGGEDRSGLSLPPLPFGYHRLRLRIGSERAESIIISAPRRAAAQGERRRWGVFLPLYALRTARNWGAGDYTDLAALMEWAADQGAHLVGTLPLLPHPADTVSPYSPTSRLFWDEWYVDPLALPESAALPAVAAQALRAREQARAAALVQYDAVGALRRDALRACAAAFAAHAPPARRAAFERFCLATPALAAYAAFRRRTDGGAAETPDFFRFAQWCAATQLTDAAARGAERNVALYLDFPVGVHPNGFDVAAHPAVFARRASLGAPPDPYFPDGQHWHLPPLNPRAFADGGWRYFRAALAHHLRVAGVLRIDHVMAFDRCFWIPDGCAPADGVYVRSPTEWLYAICCLESFRHGAPIVGEDVGLVPPETRAHMAEHGILRSLLLQCETPPATEALPPIPPGVLAALHTHDLPTFAAYWKTRPNPGAALARYVDHLLRSDAPYVLLNLEDCWLETEGHNRPGHPEHPNWRRKARYPLEAFATAPGVGPLLARCRSERP